MKQQQATIKCPCCENLITINLGSDGMFTAFLNDKVNTKPLPCIDLGEEKGDTYG